MSIPWMFPEYINIYWFNVSQTLLTSFVSLVFFIIFILIYNKIKAKNENNLFVSLVDMLIESIHNLFSTVSDKLPINATIYVLFLFFYILWNNLFWLFIDFFGSAVPFLHHNFRPVNTDIFFNAILAIVWVIWAIVYWFKNDWFKFIEKYIPSKWVWLIQKIDKWRQYPLKFIDIMLWLFIWLIEFLWEFTKVLSLTVRLFWNMFAWVVLLTLITAAAVTAFKVPFLAPLIVFIIELFESFLQAFVFSLLVLIYFKMAEESH